MTSEGKPEGIIDKKTKRGGEKKMIMTKRNKKRGTISKAKEEYSRRQG